MALVFRISANGGGGGGGGSYITPFAYYDFETSGSQYVTNVLGANNYTGSLEGSGQEFKSSDTFSGSYSMSFPSSANSRITLGTPGERNEWNTLFSGSFSISMWVKPKHTTGDYNNMIAPLFSLQDNSTSGPGTYGFQFMLGRNGSFGAPVVESSAGNGGGGGWSGTSTFSDGLGSYPYTANAWNHFVFVVEGGQSDDDRLIKAYINNNYVGFASSGGTARRFQNNWRQTDTVTLGTTYTSTFETFVDMDEVSIWSTALSAGQVNALYNSGNGANALTALTSSS